MTSIPRERNIQDAQPGSLSNGKATGLYMLITELGPADESLVATIEKEEKLHDEREKEREEENKMGEGR